MSKSIVIDSRGNPWLKTSSNGILKGIYATYKRIDIDINNISEIALTDRSGFELICKDGTRIRSLKYFPDSDKIEEAELSTELISKLIESKNLN